MQEPDWQDQNVKISVSTACPAQKNDSSSICHDMSSFSQAAVHLSHTLILMVNVGSSPKLGAILGCSCAPKLLGAAAYAGLIPVIPPCELIPLSLRILQACPQVIRFFFSSRYMLPQLQGYVSVSWHESKHSYHLSCSSSLRIMLGQGQ